MIEKGLKELGFDEREAAVYLLLIRLGSGSATELIKELGWHRQLVYNALERLEREGLVSSIQQGSKQAFRPAPPRKIAEKTAAKLDLANELVSKLENLRSKKLPDQVVQVHPGFVGVQFVHEDILSTLKKGESVRTLGASGTDYARVMGDYHDDWTSRRIKKGIKLLALSAQSEEQAIEELFTGKTPLTVTRYLPASFDAPTSTKIYGPKVVIQIWGPAEPVMILIENAKVAQNYRHYFRLLWDLADKWHKQKETSGYSEEVSAEPELI